MISAPAVHSFRHVAHVGINKDGIFEASKGLDDTWKSTLADIQGHGISVCDTDVLRQSNFGDGFWRGVEAIRAVDSSDADKYSGRVSHVFKDIGRKTDNDSHLAKIFRGRWRRYQRCEPGEMGALLCRI